MGTKMSRKKTKLIKEFRDGLNLTYEGNTKIYPAFREENPFDRISAFKQAILQATEEFSKQEELGITKGETPEWAKHYPNSLKKFINEIKKVLK